MSKDFQDFIKNMEELNDPPMPKSKKEKKDESIYTSFFETDKFIYEEVLATVATDATEVSEGRTMFAKYDKEADTVEYVNEFEHQGKVYRPIEDEALLKGGIVLPNFASNYENTKEILDEIKDFFHEYMELPTFYEAFLPNLVLFYWVYEKFPFIPYLQFVGRTATGKSTAMEVMGSICYKPIDTTGSLTIASMFRMATTWKGTMLIDEFDQVGESAKEITSFLKSGVSDRLVLRTEGDIKKEVKAYVVKSPKIFTSENPINDAGLQSRTMVVKMEKAKRKLPLFRLKNYYEKSQSIRNKLLLWRFRNLNKIDLKTIEFGFDELATFDRRVQQVITPIYYFSDDETKKGILLFAGQQEIETKRERRENLDGKIFEFISENINRDITLVEISEYLENNGKKFVSERKISGIIRTVLGFEIIRKGHENKRTIVFEGQEEKIKELRNYYGCELKENESSPSSAQVAQVASVANSKSYNTINNNIYNNNNNTNIDIESNKFNQEVEELFNG